MPGKKICQPGNLNPVAHLFGLGLICWLGRFFWTFSLSGFEVARLILAVLVTRWVLCLTIQWVQGFFAGQAAGGGLEATGRRRDRPIRPRRL